MDTSDAPPAQDANAAAGFLAPSDLAAAKAQVISKSGKRGWLDWRKCDWDRWGAAPRATAPLEVSEGRAFVLAQVPLKERFPSARCGSSRACALCLAVLGGRPCRLGMCLVRGRSALLC